MSERCFICGEDNTTVLQEHHILPRRYGGGNSDDNLVTLCANCHEAVEKIYDDEFYEQAGCQGERSSDGGFSHHDPVSVQTATESVREFLDCCADVHHGGVAVKRELYNRYVEWASKKEDAPVPANNVFGKAMIAVYGYDIDRAQRRYNGVRERVYTGVSLSADD